jgi:hypothetical protein
MEEQGKWRKDLGQDFYVFLIKWKSISRAALANMEATI